MKKNLIRTLAVTLIFSILLPMFILERNVNAEEDTGPVGEPWITIQSENRTQSISFHGVYNNQILIIDEGTHTFSPPSIAEIPLASPGGTYNTTPWESSDFEKVIGSGGKRWGRLPFGNARMGSTNKQLISAPNKTVLIKDVSNNWHGYAGYSIFREGKEVKRIHSLRETNASVFLTDEYLGYIYYDSYYDLGVREWMYNAMLYEGSYGKYLFYSDVNNIYNNLFVLPTLPHFYITHNFRRLYRIDKQGNMTYLLSANRPSVQGVIEDKSYIIFCAYDDRQNYNIYRANMNGSMQTLLTEDIKSSSNILFISNNYIYYTKSNKTYRQHVEYTGINELMFNFTPGSLYTLDDDIFYYVHPDVMDTIFKYSLNDPPELTLNTPLNSTESANYYVKEEGLSTINVSGSVRDINNDTLTVTATLGGVTKSATITNTATAKTFNFTFDVFLDNLADGTHTLTVQATDSKGATSPVRTRTIIIKGRVRHDDYVLVNSSLVYSLLYQDVENDPKYQEQFRYVHNPNYFKNPQSIIPDSNTWRNSLYNKLSLPGHYKITYRAKDNPKNVAAFDEYRMWSRESLSEINLYVHRKPIAVFKATINSSGRVTITDVDKSYDPDHQGETNNGIIARQWRWRKVEDVIWNVSNNPPTSLTPGEEYILGLRVRDKDGENGIGVWSDWTDITLGTGSLAPLNALFTLNPNVVSHNPSKTITVTNLSSGPITRYEWIIRNSSGTQVGSTITTNVPTSAQLKQGGIGKYTLTLRVGDATRWSEPYTLPYEVINNPPIASFEGPDVVYRDTNIALINTTPNDLDGDTITYQWKLKQPNGTEYNISTAKNPTFKIQSFIETYNINPVSAISKNWEIKLIATDAKGAKSEFTKELEVINSIPEAEINGPTSVMQYTTHNYMSNDIDADSGDNPLSIFRWKHIKPNGSFELYTTKDITTTFNEVGTHTLEHYAIDRIGDKSNVATLNVNVIENKAPSMVITSPNGTITKPTVIPDDPLMQWNYSDTENDPQEKYSFDFYYADDDILEKTMTNNDPTGNIREYQVPNGTFERFRPIKALGRVFSKYKWSELSNEVFFIINDAPIGDFSFNKNPATYVRGEEIIITGSGDDPNLDKGDSINFKYYLKKLPDGKETLISDKKDFTHVINTLTLGKASETYQIRQVVTDSLGYTAPEVIKTFTINNQKPIVEILEPSSSDKNDPYSFSDLKPTIRWIYSDLDGDSQKKYIVNIFEGDTNNLVVSSGEISSSSSSWTLPIELVEDKLYSVRVEVYDGHEWNTSSTKYFKVFSLKISGYLVPNPAMAGDKIYFYISTEGYADKLEIVVPNDLIAMDKRVEMGYPAVSYPSLFFNVDKNVYKKEDILDYIVWVTTEETIDKNNVRLRQPYKFIVRAYKGEMTREIELDLDIRGSILELLKPGIKNKYGN